MAPSLCAISSKFVALFITLLVYSAVQRVEGLSCWECNSKHDPNCGEPFKNHTISYTDCSQRFLLQDPGLESTICRKIVQKVLGETRVIRGCGFLDTEDPGPCFMRAGTHQVFMYYCQCRNADGCNVAQHRQPWKILVGFVSASLLVLPCVWPPSSPISGLS